MILRPLYRRFSPILTAYLLLVSVGLPLQRGYCMCIGEQWISLTDDEHDCTHGLQPEVVFVGEQIPCCTVTNGCQFADSDHGCDDTETVLAQLDVDFTHELTHWSLANAPLIHLPAAPYWAQPGTLARPKTLPIRGPDPPPLPGGRALLVVQQTFLI